MARERYIHTYGEIDEDLELPGREKELINDPFEE
jgi:hypothetical protein